MVYVASGTGTLFALTGSGVQAWNSSVASAIYSSSPAAKNGMIYIGAEDGKLRAFDSMTGAQRWNVRCWRQGPWHAGPDQQRNSGHLCQLHCKRPDKRRRGIRQLCRPSDKLRPNWGHARFSGTYWSGDRFRNLFDDVNDQRCWGDAMERFIQGAQVESRQELRSPSME